MWTFRRSITDLLAALEKIAAIHYTTAHVSMVEDQLNVFDDRYSTYENNFTAQLYLHYPEQAADQRHLVRQLQIPKRYVYSSERDELVVAALERLKEITGVENDIRQLTTIPDFFIHQDENNRNRINQQLIVEVKTEHDLDYPKFAWDFFKLNLYLNKYNFQTACFLVVNTKMSAIRSYVLRYIREGLYLADRPKDLFVIIKENHSDTPIIYTLRYLIGGIG